MLKKWNSTLLFCAIVASLGGFLFGYNTSVISGALLFMTKEFGLTTFQQEFIVSILLIGCLFGALFGGGLADRFGRKPLLFTTCLLFFVGTFFMVIAQGTLTIFLGRFIGGLGIGLASLVVPLYLAEISPAKSRGAIVSFNQLAITIGILVAYIVNLGFSGTGDFRWMFAFEFFPAALFFLSLFFIPETPSYLSRINKKSVAETVLKKLGHKTDMQESAPISKKVSLKLLFHPSVKSAFFIGILLSVFQQITGINIVIYYAPTIFSQAGFQSAQSAIFATVGVGVVNVIMTIVALFLIDRIGRKPLLYIGLIGMIISLAVLGLSFQLHNDFIAPIAMICLMSYVAFFAISLGPIAWLIISEIYPLEIRGKAMGIATGANWICNFIVSLTFLTLIAELGKTGTFWVYSIIGIIALLFVWKKVPETKGKTFAQIQQFWKK